MNKQKQLNEMHQILLSAGYDWWKTAPNGKTKSEYEAECFYNAGYRKIPENAVVLTSGDKVDMFDSEASGFMTSSIGDLPLNIDGMRKAVDEIARLLIVQAELQDFNAKYYNEAKDLRRKLNNDGAIYSRLEVDGFIDKARKETAEKFAERLKEKAVEFTFGQKVVPIQDIDETLKEFTGEK